MSAELVPISSGVSTYTPPPSLAAQVADNFLFAYSNASTRENYTRGLLAWFKWCAEVGFDPLEATRTHVERFLRWSEEVKGIARRTNAAQFTAMRGFYKRAVMEGHLDRSPCEFVKAPYVQRLTTTNDISRMELARILKLARKHSERDYAIFCILGFNGLRNAELCGIDIEDIGRDRGYTNITVNRKGGKRQTFTLSAETSEAVRACIGERKTGPLFVSARNPLNRITSSDLQALVKRYARKADIPRRISPHSLRHTFITQALNAGVSQREVQHAAGHADGRMVSYYDHGNTNAAAEATHAVTAYIAEVME